MKRIIPIILFMSFLFIEPGCKQAIEDAIDCTIESAFLIIHADVDATNSKLFHFEFINNDTEGSFTLDQEINWDFGDGNTGISTNNKIDHIYADTGYYKAVANYTLRRGDASCNGPKDKDINVH